LSGRRRHPWRGRSMIIAACHARSVPMMAPDAAPAPGREVLADGQELPISQGRPGDARPSRPSAIDPGGEVQAHPWAMASNERSRSVRALYPRQWDAASPDVPAQNLKEILERLAGVPLNAENSHASTKNRVTKQAVRC
jgi:hypothetical protein